MLSRLLNSFSRSFRGRLALMVIAITLPAASLALVLVNQAYENEKASVARHLLASSRVVSALVDQEIEEVTLLLRSLSGSNAIERGDFPSFYQRARTLVSDDDRWIVLSNAEGQQLVNTRVPRNAPLPKMSLDDAFYAKMRTGSVYVSDLTHDVVANGPVAYVAYPIFRKGELVYTLHLAMLPSALSRALRVERFAPGSIVALVDHTGTVITRSRNADRFVGGKATADVVAAIAVGQEGIGDSVTLEGISVVRAFCKSSVSGWSVVIGAPHSDLYASARHLLWLSLSLTAGLGAVAVLMAVWIGNTLARSVEKLAEEAGALVRGGRWIDEAPSLLETEAVSRAMRRTAERLDLALSAAKLGFWSWDSETDLVVLSERGAEIFGSPPKLSWTQLRDLLHPKDAERARLAVERAISGREDYQIEYRVRRGAADFRWVSAIGRPVYDQAGKSSGMIGIVQDIALRKRSELQQDALYRLGASVNRAEALPEIYDAAMDAICEWQQVNRAAILLLDSEGKMRFTNHRGLSEAYRNAVEGHSPWKLDESDPQSVCIEDVATVNLAADLREAVEREGIRSLIFIPLTYNKSLVGKFMVYYDEPHRIGPDELRPLEAMATQVAFAIQRQKNAEALETLVDERTTSLRQAVAQMHEFSYSVSHDLRAPVRAMRGYAEAVLEDYGERLDEEGRDLLKRIQRNGVRMDRLIQDLLTYSRLTREVQLEPVSLEKLFQEVIQQYPAMQPDRADIEIPPGMPEVIAHEPSLTQVVSNLLSNAVKFVRHGVRPRVVVSAEVREGSVRVWFTDNGIGISPQHQGRLFGMFERIHPDEAYEGTGIGLAIVRKAMERMNGSAGVESDGISGSRFWIELRGSF